MNILDGRLDKTKPALSLPFFFLLFKELLLTVKLSTGATLQLSEDLMVGKTINKQTNQ